MIFSQRSCVTILIRLIQIALKSQEVKKHFSKDKMYFEDQRERKRIREEMKKWIDEAKTKTQLGSDWRFN